MKLVCLLTKINLLFVVERMIVEPNPSPANEVLFNLYCKLEQRMIGAIQTEDTQLLKELCLKAEAEWPQQLSELIAWGYRIIEWEEDTKYREKNMVQPKQYM